MKDGSFSDKSSDNNSMRGTVKNGVMNIWRKNMKKKDAPVITVSINEIKEALKHGGANSNATLFRLAKQKDYAFVESWIEKTESPKLRKARRDAWEKDTLTGKYSAIENRVIDSAAQVIKKLYEIATGKKAKTPYELKNRKEEG